MADKTKPKLRFSAVLDAEIKVLEQDRFGHRHFTELLTEYIESYKPPYSIGLLGPWGVGKSSIKSLYESGLRKNSKRSKNIKTISFNAWRFGGENLKRSLIAHVYTELGGCRETLDDSLFRQINRPVDEKLESSELLKRIKTKFGWATAQLLMVALLTYLTSLALFEFIEGDGLKTALATVILGAYATLSKFFLDSSFDDNTWVRNITKVDLPFTGIEQFQSLLIDKLDSLPKKWNRLVIFVDDLDRLPQEEMVQGIEAIRAFLELNSRRNQDYGIIFVISCDEDKVAEALRERLGDKNEAKLSRRDAKAYLDRIFQFRIEIPPPPKLDMRKFATDKLLSIAPELPEALLKLGTNVETVIERLIHSEVKNPRAALQTVNSFYQSWCLAGIRETETGDKDVGGLSVGAVTAHPISLAALTTLKVNFPDFYADLQVYPRLIKAFETIFIQKQDGIGLSETVFNLLSEYGQVSRIDNQHQLSKEHYPLRTIISSFGGVRWPNSIQPLLLLSQNPLTRKLGDKAPSIFEALINNDAYSLLEVLGRHLDEGELTEEQAYLVRATFKDIIHSENEVRQENSVAALVKLYGRFPKEAERHTATRLARSLAGSRSLRWRVGISAICEIVNSCDTKEWSPIAESIAKDYLGTDVELLTMSHESPSLEEGKQMVAMATELVLTIAGKVQLQNSTEEILEDWLLDRTKEIKGGEFSFTYAEFETWLNNFEKAIIAILGTSYLELLSEHLLVAGATLPNAEKAFTRAEDLLKEQIDAGEESRNEAGLIITSLAGSPNPGAREFARRFFSECAQTIQNPELGQEFLDAQALALYDVEVEPKELLEFEALIRPEFVAPSGGESLANLAIELSEYDGWVRISKKIATAFLKVKNPHLDKILKHWVDRISEDLPSSAIEWLSVNYGKIEVSQREELVAALSNSVNAGSTTVDSETYATFFTNLSIQQYSDPVLKAHAHRVIQYLGNKSIVNWPKFREAVLPSVPILIQIEGDGEFSGTNISSYMSYFANHAEVLGFSHLHLREAWGLLSDNIPQAEQIFATAISIFSSAVNHEHSPAVLISLATMLENNIVTASNSQKLSGLASKIWNYHPEAIGAFLSGKTKVRLTAPQLASLAESVETEGEIENLKLVWDKYIETSDLDYRKACVTELTFNEPKAVHETNDFAVDLWLQQGGLKGDDEFSSWFHLSEAEDAGRARVFLHWVNQGSEEPVEVISAILRVPEHEETIGTLFEHRQRISVKGLDAKTRLAQSLLEAVTMLESVPLKKEAILWIKSLRLGQALSKMHKGLTFTDEGKKLLKAHLKLRL